LGYGNCLNNTDLISFGTLPDNLEKNKSNPGIFYYRFLASFSKKDLLRGIADKTSGAFVIFLAVAPEEAVLLSRGI